MGTDGYVIYQDENGFWQRQLLCLHRFRNVFYCVPDMWKYMVVCQEGKPVRYTKFRRLLLAFVDYAITDETANGPYYERFPPKKKTEYWTGNGREYTRAADIKTVNELLFHIEEIISCGGGSVPDDDGDDLSEYDINDEVTSEEDVVISFG